MDVFIGTVMLFAGDFAPVGWAFCNGQLLSISQNAALFAILGTKYGGDGVRTFALPDLRGCVPVGMGQGPGLSPYNIGQRGGAESVTLTTQQMPAHSHSIGCFATQGNKTTPSGNIPAAGAPVGNEKPYSDNPANATMSAAMVGQSGQGLPVSVVQPYLAMNYIIATQGIFPPHS